MLKSLNFELTTAIVLLLSAPAFSAPLENWSFDPNTNQLEVTVPAGITPRYSLLAQPTRIVLDLPETQIGAVQPRATYNGAVREIRVSQFQPNVARIVLELAPNATLDNQQAQLQQLQGKDQTVSRWTLRPVFVASAPSANTQAVFNALRPIQTAPTQTQIRPDSTQPTPTSIQTPVTSTQGTAIPIPVPSASTQTASTPVPPTSQTPPIAQSTPTNDFGLPPAPPTIDTAPNPNVTAPDLPPIQASPLPTAPAVLPPLQPPAAGSGNSPGSSLLFPTAPAQSTPQSTTPSNPLQLPEVNPSLAIPNSFPPVNAPTAQPTVTVPQLDRRSTPQAQPTAPQATTLPIEDTPVPVRSRTIEFGQPLPTLNQ